MRCLRTVYVISAIVALCLATIASGKLGFTTPQLISHPDLSLASLEEGPAQTVRIRLDIFGERITLQLRPNQELLHMNYAFQHLSADQIRSQSGVPASCHFTGRVYKYRHSVVAVSTCRGQLRGLISFNQTDYFIEPLIGSENDTHFIYTNTKHDTILTPSDILFDKSDWLGDLAREQARHIRKTRTYSIRNRRYYLEAMVALDETLVRHHGTHSESYTLTLMNTVSGLFRLPSLSQSLTLVVSRLVSLESGTNGFEWNTANPELSLSDFCEWQQRVNGTLSHTTHDFAILLTRRPLCPPNTPCYVIGVANVGGMCSGAHACLIVRDQGVMLGATTVTHEIGHLFGMHHDESGFCARYRIPSSSYIMTQIFTATSNHFAWSECSKHAIADFLSRGGDRCLLNRPTNQIELPTIPLSADAQCNSILGQGSRIVPSRTTCGSIVCSYPTSDHGLRLSVPMQDNTPCSINSSPGRCQSGVCVGSNELIRPINGQWSQWSNWSECSHTCDTGVQHRERECDAPSPSNGGKTCLGERKQYTTCHLISCPTSTPSRRTLACQRMMSHETGQWHALSNNYRVSDPCQLICQERTLANRIAALGHVADGSECHGVSASEGLCVLGSCIQRDCSGELAGPSKRDACGVCRGDGTTCRLVTEEIREDLPSFALHQLITIPPTARRVSLLNLAPTPTFFLAVSQEGRTALFRTNHRHLINGVTWLSSRLPNGTDQISTSGPFSAPIQVKFWGGPTSISLRVSYVLPPPIEIHLATPDVLHWLPECAQCNATCGVAIRHCHSVCVDVGGTRVDELLCDQRTKPDNTTQRCENMSPCPTFFWTATAWGPCSPKCGTGRKSRLTLCFARTQLAFLIADDSNCGLGSRPATSLPCRRHCATPAPLVPSATQSHTSQIDTTSPRLDNSTTKSHTSVTQSDTSTTNSDTTTKSATSSHSATSSPSTEPSVEYLGKWVVRGCNCKTNQLIIECRIRGVKHGESNCEPSARPEGNCGTQCPHWQVGQWGNCGRNCRQRRVVQCVRNGVTVPPGVCHRAKQDRPTQNRRYCPNCP